MNGNIWGKGEMERIFFQCSVVDSDSVIDVALHVLEVPMKQPLSRQCPDRSLSNAFQHPLRFRSAQESRSLRKI